MQSACSVSEAFELILPYVPELEPYLADDGITAIMVNPAGSVYVDRNGEMEHIGSGILDPVKLMYVLERIAHQLDDEISETSPVLDARLPDGSRIAALIPPFSLNGPTVTIRKFRRQYFSLARLVEHGTLSPGTAQLLRAALLSKGNILISGHPGSGKTSLANALLNELDPHKDRVTVIEESAEMQIDAENVTRFECRNTGGFRLTIRDLVKVALRHNPNHLVIGEIRGAEAMDLLDALNIGCGGSMSTIHAKSAASALTKLGNFALRADMSIPLEAIQAQIADVITYVVQMERRGDKRIAVEVARLASFDPKTRTFEFDPIGD